MKFVVILITVLLLSRQCMAYLFGNPCFLGEKLAEWGFMDAQAFCECGMFVHDLI